MKGSLKLGTVAGIGVYVHFTFVLLLGWIFISYLVRGYGLGPAAEGAGFVLAIFGCVVLHELGHALTAKRYGIRTRDITLLPIGGLARLERIPENPFQELAVALAGPAVNVLIAGGLFAVRFLQHGAGAAHGLAHAALFEGDLLTRLFWMNLFLAGFNLLPAFPMDGGRVLRAILATRMDRGRATRVAATVGQGMAILFGLFGLLGAPMLLFVALFVYLGAQNEAEMVAVQQMLQDHLVRDAMMTRFRTLSAEATLDDAVHELLAGSQQDFPVLADGQLVGILQRNDLVKAIAQGGGRASVESAMRRSCSVVDVAEPLRAAFEKMRQSECTSLPVVQNEQLAGLLTLENVGELVMVSEAAGQFERRS